MISNELTEKDTLKQYVTSCYELTLTTDSGQIKTFLKFMTPEMDRRWKE